MSAQASDAGTVLRRAGHRLTGQRRLLLEIIQGQSGHMDAGELYRLARTRVPDLNLSTVYRTLNLLSELGLVDELHLGEEHHHYEARPAAEHYHLVCSECGRVIEFSSPLGERLKEAVAAEHGFEVTELTVEVVGHCDRCRSESSGFKEITIEPGTAS